jgi:hypothetical protein
VVKGFAIWMRPCNICHGFDRQFGRPLIKPYSCAYLAITKYQLDLLGCGYLFFSVFGALKIASPPSNISVDNAIASRSTSEREP